MMVQAGHWQSDLDPIVKLGQYIDDSTDILVEDASQVPLLAEVELRLPNLFKHKHPMTSYDLVVVWSSAGCQTVPARWPLGGRTGAPPLSRW